ESSLFGVTVSCHPELVSGSRFDLIQGRVLATRISTLTNRYMKTIFTSEDFIWILRKTFSA
ncbi:MAG TPA: hypothetical protein P5212_09540, partial [Mesotoga sp.]|nr:hypothetical protein [Mesotoga sp.]